LISIESRANVENRVHLAQTDWRLLKHSARKYVRGKQQEHVVPLYESHGHNELQLEYDNFRFGLRLEFEEYKFGGGWKDFCFVARFWVNRWNIYDVSFVVLLKLMGEMDGH
jgi:hypothetical protein